MALAQVGGSWQGGGNLAARLFFGLPWPAKAAPGQLVCNLAGLVARLVCHPAGLVKRALKGGYAVGLGVQDGLLPCEARGLVGKLGLLASHHDEGLGYMHGHKLCAGRLVCHPLGLVVWRLVLRAGRLGLRLLARGKLGAYLVFGQTG